MAGDILATIVRRTREREAPLFKRYELGRLRKQPRSAPRPFAASAGEVAVIAEIKRASPTKGVIRDPFHPKKLAAAFENNGAAALSVITESDFFLGSKKYLPQIRRLTDLPLLRKDFLLHPAQLIEAYNLGADWALLIVACLSDAELALMLDTCRQLGLTALCEVHDAAELERLLPLQPQLIGINNRNLQTFAVSLATSLRLRPLVPERIPLVSESGISCRDDLLRLRDAGFAAALVGEALLRADDPGRALRELLHG
jgi:indole-3-glycerol phosphate synthase